MHGKNRIRQALCGAIVAMVAISARNASALQVYIDHPSDYVHGDCHSANNDGCGDVTGSLRSGLGGLGWAVTYWTGGNAWATDFIDCSIMSGEDCAFADIANLAIFDGHGNTGLIADSYSRYGVCSAPATSMELGRFGGGTAAMFISTACCLMHMGFPYTFTDHGGLNQELGFGGDASMDSGMVGNFWSRAGALNVDPWLQELEDKPGWFTGDNTTVAFTRGANSSDVLYNRNHCALRAGICATRIGYTVGSAWQYDYYDHGTAGCNATPP